MPGNSHGQRSLVGCSPWGRTEADTTEQLHFHFSLSCIGEENGNPLQCSCLENPRDRGEWWAAVYGVTQSRTRLKRLSSSSKPFSDELCVLSRSVVSDSLQPRGLWPTRFLCPWEFSRQEYWSGLPCLPPGGLPSPGLPHWRQILHQLNHEGSPTTNPTRGKIEYW